MDSELHRGIAQSCRKLFLEAEFEEMELEEAAKPKAKSKKIDFMNKLNKSYGLRAKAKRKRPQNAPTKALAIALPKQGNISFEKSQNRRKESLLKSISPLKMILSQEISQMPPRPEPLSLKAIPLEQAKGASKESRHANPRSAFGAERSRAAVAK